MVPDNSNGIDEEALHVMPWRKGGSGEVAGEGGGGRGFCLAVGV